MIDAMAFGQREMFGTEGRERRRVEKRPEQ